MGEKGLHFPFPLPLCGFADFARGSFRRDDHAASRSGAGDDNNPNASANSA